MERIMRQFTSFDLQRHVGQVQNAALIAPVSITHHGNDRLVMMEHGTWSRLGRGDALADAIKRLQANRDLLRQEGISAISIFGSVARGDCRDDSDIDLLVEPSAGSEVGGLKLARWKTLLTSLLSRDADVVVPEFLRNHVKDTMVHDLVEAVVIRPHAVSNAA
jgi:predicted nucleotidyltransferase